MLLCFHEGMRSLAPKIPFQNLINEDEKNMYVHIFSYDVPNVSQMSKENLLYNTDTYTHLRHMEYLLTSHPHTKHSSLWEAGQRMPSKPDIKYQFWPLTNGTKGAQHS